MMSSQFHISCQYHFSKDLLSTKHIIIIGGGYAGIKLALLMKQWKIPFKLIDPKGFFFINVAAQRAVLYPDFVNNVMIPYKPTFGDNFVKGNVLSVDFDKKEVTLAENMESLQYTDLVLAVGSRGPFPGKCDAKTSEDVHKAYRDLAIELDKAIDVILVGGGPVGIELAGEVAERYTNELITLIHPTETLASKRYHSDGFQNKIRKKLKQFTVKIVQGKA